ncbi:MAG TPA: hypothetical protein VFI48_15200, partial [Hyphomicrobiaceae bacterium]|nr:hypothetical protein [Hyphomicrobiaceae bacterium]
QRSNDLVFVPDWQRGGGNCARRILMNLSAVATHSGQTLICKPACLEETSAIGLSLFALL